MKNLLNVIIFSVFFISCQSNHPDYDRNLATAKKLFQLHGEEDLEAQLALVSKDIESISPIYGSSSNDYEGYKSMLKAYHDGFEDIQYTANNWLPGTDSLGKLDGSVRTYGNWTGKNSATGKKIDLNGYWYFNFDNDGKVIVQGDFFDFGGMYDAVYPKNLIFAQVNIKKGKASDMIEILNSEGGLPATRAYDGCISAEMVYNEESNTAWIVSNWATNDHYLRYLDWRMNSDQYKIVEKMTPLMEGGENGLVLAHTNSNYSSY
ncbi:MAG: hypothetical protein P8L24_02880 [Cytophagales bacterium]|nr:hypothetical protein [Cytophagales bacterium]